MFMIVYHDSHNMVNTNYPEFEIHIFDKFVFKYTKFQHFVTFS